MTVVAEEMVIEEMNIPLGGEAEISETPAMEEQITEDNSSTPVFDNAQTQTPQWKDYSVQKFVYDNDGIHFYTGLESYDKLMFVFQTLLHTAGWVYFEFFMSSNFLLFLSFLVECRPATLEERVTESYLRLIYM